MTPKSYLKVLETLLCNKAIHSCRLSSEESHRCMILFFPVSIWKWYRWVDEEYFDGSVPWTTFQSLVIWYWFLKDTSYSIHYCQNCFTLGVSNNIRLSTVSSNHLFWNPDSQNPVGSFRRYPHFSLVITSFSISSILGLYGFNLSSNTGSLPSRYLKWKVKGVTELRSKNLIFP